MLNRTTMRPFVMLALCSGCVGSGSMATIEPSGTYILERTLEYSTPCPNFAFPEVVVTIATGAITATAGARAQPAEDVEIDGGRVAFVAHEGWTSSDGDAWARVAYDLEGDADLLEGEASTSFVFDTETSGTTCEYRWLVRGTR